MTAQIEPFRTIAISRLAHELKAQGRDIIHMEFGQPSTGAPPKAIAAAHHVMDVDGFGYWESVPLRAAIAAHYRAQYGVDVDPARVMLTAGASPALVLALNAQFSVGARIGFAVPGYVAYRNVSKALHMQAVEMRVGPDTRFQLTADIIAAEIAQSGRLDGLILSSPANPTGSIIAPADMAEIAALCARENITLISDEIYHGLVYEGVAACALAYAPDAIIINSFSKYFSMAGWRLGWMVVPEALIDPVRARIGNLFLTPSSVAQHAALAAFDDLSVLAGHINTYRANRALLLEALPQMGLDKIAPPDGAFYIYADIGRFSDNSLAFCEEILRATGVATASGMDFDPQDGHFYMRFSFAVSTEEVSEAIERLTPFFKAKIG